MCARAMSAMVRARGGGAIEGWGERRVIHYNGTIPRNLTLKDHRFCQFIGDKLTAAD